MDLRLEDFGVREDDDWSSLVFASVYPGESPFTKDQLMGWEEWGDHIPLGHIFVIQTNREDAVWKLPGGHKRSGETPLQTARRELQGETGLLLDEAAFHYVGKEHRRYPKPHWSCLCTASLTEFELRWLHNHDEGNEGEMPKFFRRGEFDGLVRDGKFLPPHYQWLLGSSLILNLNA